jgi:hypothetical protein
VVVLVSVGLDGAPPDVCEPDVSVLLAPLVPVVLGATVVVVTGAP